MITRVTYVLTFVELMLLVAANRAVYFHSIHNILLFLLLLTMQKIYTDVQIGCMLENLLQCYQSKVATQMYHCVHRKIYIKSKCH